MAQHTSRPRRGKPGKPGKPAKPYADFPLFPHATKRWAKKIRGKLHYFGPWGDPDGALRKYQEQRDDLHAGRTPRVQGEGFALRDLLNRFLSSKKLAVDSGELSSRTWGDYFQVSKHLEAVFGLTRLVSDLTPDAFEKLKTHFGKLGGAVRVGNLVNQTRVVFNWAFEQRLVDREIWFGPAFRRPSKKPFARNVPRRGRE